MCARAAWPLAFKPCSRYARLAAELQLLIHFELRLRKILGARLAVGGLDDDRAGGVERDRAVATAAEFRAQLVLVASDRVDAAGRTERGSQQRLQHKLEDKRENGVAGVDLESISHILGVRTHRRHVARQCLRRLCGEWLQRLNEHRRRRGARCGADAIRKGVRCQSVCWYYQ